MSAQDVMLGAQVLHLRELKAEVARLKAENDALRTENTAFRTHFDWVLLAANDLKDGPLEIWDGWNLILGAERVAADRAELLAQAQAKGTRIWIVFDGPDEQVRQDGNVRISYTGGTGEHRADKLIVDFVRMAAYLGLADRVSVRTNDRDFLRQVRRIRDLKASRGD